MPLPTVAAVSAGAIRAGVWVGTASVTYYSVKTSFSPRQNDNIPYRPGDGIPSTRSIMQHVFYGSK